MTQDEYIAMFILGGYVGGIVALLLIFTIVGEIFIILRNDKRIKVPDRYINTRFKQPYEWVMKKAFFLKTPYHVTDASEYALSFGAWPITLLVMLIRLVCVSFMYVVHSTIKGFMNHGRG